MKKTGLFFFFIAAAALFSACQGNEQSAEVTVASKTAEAFDQSAFTITEVGNSGFQRAERRNAEGVLLEQGFLRSGKRHGTWVTYYPTTQIPHTIATYIDDQYNGPYMEFAEHGNIELQAGYKNNLLDGYWAKYRFERPINEATYAEGKLNGVYREYIMGTGRLQKEISYKMGVMDGPFRFFNDQGQVSLEYQYKNGQKVGGGILGPGGPNEPR